MGEIDLKRISYLETIEKLSIEKHEVMQTNPELSWIDLILCHLQHRILPTDRDKAKKLKYLTVQYLIYNGKLYKRSFILPLLRHFRPQKLSMLYEKFMRGSVAVT